MKKKPGKRSVLSTHYNSIELQRADISPQYALFLTVRVGKVAETTTTVPARAISSSLPISLTKEQTVLRKLEYKLNAFKFIIAGIPIAFGTTPN